jgi:hypothetical protein
MCIYTFMNTLQATSLRKRRRCSRRLAASMATAMQQQQQQHHHHHHLPEIGIRDQQARDAASGLSPTEECCFVAREVVLGLFESQSRDAPDPTGPALIRDWMRASPPGSFQVVQMVRDDNAGFHLEFNHYIDKVALRRADYQEQHRIKHITGVALPGAVAIEEFTYPENTVACAPWKEGSDAAYDAAACVATRGTYFQARLGLTSTVLHVHRGQIKVMLTPAENLSALVQFPALHALRGQSQLAFHGRAEHESMTVLPFTQYGLRVPAFNVTLGADDVLYVPPYWGHRVVVQADAFFTMHLGKRSAFLDARLASSKLLPKLLQYGALVGQPFFLAMWSLAVYFDEMLELSPLTRKGSKVDRAVFFRWGPGRVVRGHADDPLDPAAYGAEVTRNVREECAEMARTPKDLMLQDREQFMDELKTAARQARRLFERTTEVEALLMELMMDQMDLAVAEALSTAACTPFYHCYFAGYPGVVVN